MSAYNSTLLSLPSNDHFQSAYMQGYGAHHHTSYEDHRYSSSSQYFSNNGDYLTERRLNDQYLRSPATHIPRLSGTGSSYAASSLEYGARGITEFDPRPVHAGWTPKEEIDDEMQQRELLSGNVMSSRTPPAGDLGIHPANLSPRSESLSPGLTSLPSVPSLPGAPGSSASGSGANSKTYSFVSLPGNAVRKRPRRRYDEIERLYACSWPDCTKAYGTLNHLNAHVTMQRHGPKRSPAEFKELRKQWRAQKKHEQTNQIASRPSANTHPALVPSSAPSSGPVLTSDLDPSSLPGLRHRRATEPSLPMHSLHHPHSHLAPHPSYTIHHRLSLGDLRYSNGEEDQAASALVTTPTSTNSDGGLPPNSATTGGGYWHDSPLSSYSLSLQPPHTQHHNPSPPLTPLTPPGQPMSRLGPGSTLLQPLSAGTLAALEAGLDNQTMGDERSGTA